MDDPLSRATCVGGAWCETEISKVRSAPQSTAEVKSPTSEGPQASLNNLQGDCRAASAFSEHSQGEPQRTQGVRALPRHDEHGLNTKRPFDYLFWT